MQLAHNSEALYTTKPATGGFWAQFQADILEHTNDLQDLEHCAKSTMPALHQYLCSQSEYQTQMARIQHEEIEGYSFSSTLFEDGNFRVNLNAIVPDRGLALHDHPGSAGLTYIIQGRANVVLCDATTDAHISNAQSSLSVMENKTFSSGEISCFTKDKHNIHTISAISERCVMLVVHTNTAMLKNQSFYFSANKEKNIGLQLITQRVSRQTLKNFSKNKFKKLTGTSK